MEKSELTRRYGTLGAGSLTSLARRGPAQRVEPSEDAKSISAETTFDTDIGNLEELTRMLWRLAEKVSATGKAETRRSDRHAQAQDPRLPPAQPRSSLAEATQLAHRMFDAASPLLEREADGTLFRLIGIGVSDFAEAHLADPGDLLDPGAAKRAAAEAAVDDIRSKFGNSAVELGLVFGRAGRGRKDGKPTAQS